jgi:hypothetical protein
MYTFSFCRGSEAELAAVTSLRRIRRSAFVLHQARVPCPRNRGQEHRRIVMAESAEDETVSFLVFFGLKHGLTTMAQ